MNSDLDEDFFTPLPGTSLANVFNNKNSDDTKKPENTSLKYVAPKSSDFENIEEENQGPQIENNKVVDQTSKSSQCVFAHAVFAYELINNTYALRGRLGLALLKSGPPLDIKLVLYDSNKRALSSASVKSKLEVKIQNNKYISYCDDMKKIWSLSCFNLEELNIIVQTFRQWDISITYYDGHMNEQPSTSKPVKNTFILSETKDSCDKESDTDSLINRKAKTSILNRMALVGQSVLPSPPTEDKTSDSSDTDFHHRYRISRHKPHKTNSKRQQGEKGITDGIPISGPAHIVDTEYQTSVIKTPIQRVEDIKMSTDLKQLVSVTNFNNDSLSHSRDMEHFVSEQRINNTELRININRVADKVDLILDKIKNSECKSDFCNNSDYNKNVLQKLLTEYENRIKDQNEKIKKLETLVEHRASSAAEYDVLENQVKKNCDDDKISNLILKVECLEKENSDKIKEIFILKDEVEDIRGKLIIRNEKIQELESKCASVINRLDKKTDEFEQLKLTHCEVNDELCQLKEKFREVEHKSSDEQLRAKLKSIMNSTFRSLAANFDNDENYSGDLIKTIVGTIIKKTTMEVLNTQELVGHSYST